MEAPNNVDALMEPNAQVFVTPQYKSFIKPASYSHPKLKPVTMRFLTEDFETKDVDFNKVYAVNEFFHLKETNADICKNYEEIESLNKHRAMIQNVGTKVEGSKLKVKLLERLEKSKNSFGQTSKTFSEKFEKILKKKNNVFIDKLFEIMKKIKGGIGLEFPGSLEEEVTRGHEEQLASLVTMEPGFEVKVPSLVYHSFVLDDGFILNFMENINDHARIEWHTQFYELQSENKGKDLKMVQLKHNDELRTEERIHDVKYYPEGNIIVITSTLRDGDKNLMIRVYELLRNKGSVTFEARHKIPTKGRWGEFVRAGGTEYLVYCNDLEDDEKFKKLEVMNFEETFVNSKVKPTVESMDLEIKCFKTCNLGGGYLVAEGPKNTLGLIDLSAKEALGYYREHKGEDYFNYLRACYSKTKNVLFVMHNSQNGAVVSVFSVDQSSAELQLKQNFEFYNDLKNQCSQSFANRYFEVQFNHAESRLDIVDDYQKCLFRFKLNEESKLVKDKDPITLNTETKDCTPTFLMTRLEGDLYFLQYFTFASFLKAYPIKED